MKKEWDKGKKKSSEKRIRLSEDLLWGVHPIFEGISREPELFAEIFLQKDKKGGKIEDIVALARAANIKLNFVDSISLTGEGARDVRHQGLVARINQVPLLAFDQLLSKMKARIEAGLGARLIVCDSLQDPHNLGAIIRSALASGANGVVVTRERSAPVGGTAAKSSAGAISHIDIAMVTNLASGLKNLKSAGFWVFGAVKDDVAQSVYTTDLTVPACLVVGSEGKGIRPLVKKECDILISIPMQGDIDSLNSSVAAGVILFEAMRQHLSSQ